MWFHLERHHKFEYTTFKGRVSQPMSSATASSDDLNSSSVDKTVTLTVDKPKILSRNCLIKTQMLTIKFTKGSENNLNNWKSYCCDLHTLSIVEKTLL